MPAPLAPTSPVTPGPMSTDSRSSAVTRVNRLLRLSVAITVTSSTVVIQTTPVVRPQSRLRVRLEYYEALRDPVPESYPQPLIPAIDAASNNCHIHQCQVTDAYRSRRDGAA
ncbi:hypothetical protein Scel_48080 [Streptomyces cellostaticus]|nr:hypothetical protein Scel_48080 [Streptomyces cellostaticus]